MCTTSPRRAARAHARHPRLNVVGLLRGRAARPTVHLNGHFDVVPAGGGWTVDPFGGVVRDGRIYGRGACDMKAGIAAAVFAAEAIRRAGIELEGAVEISGTVDEESGGFAGVAWLAEHGRISAGRTDAVIIPEPLNVDRICIGHRGVYWFEVTTRGRIGHGSMPFLGVNAIEHMGVILDASAASCCRRLAAQDRGAGRPSARATPRSTSTASTAASRSTASRRRASRMSAARYSIAVFSSRKGSRHEGGNQALLERAAAQTPGLTYELRDLMVVHPVRTPRIAVMAALERGDSARARPAGGHRSPARHLRPQARRSHRRHPHCVAYGPGILDLAHQPDEWCGIDDLINATKVLALAVLDLTTRRP